MYIVKKIFKYLFFFLVAATVGLWALQKLNHKLPEEVRGASDPQQAAIDAVVKLTVKDLADLNKGNSGLVMRDAHAKAHGCLKATLQVDPNIPPKLKVGLFSQPGKKYKAWLRFSNGAFFHRDDAKYDGRGLALKILDTDPSSPSSDTKVDQFDFLMIAHTTFFSPDAIDYLDFVKAGALIGKPNGIETFFMPSYNPFSWRIKQAWIGYELSKKVIESPLRMRYFTIAPFAFGPGRSVKYSSQPCKGSALKPKIIGDKSDPNYLKAVLKKELQTSSACFELSVQLNKGGHPIDDATVEWSEQESPFQRVATIDIPSQDFSAPQRKHFCEHSDFNPGRTMDGFQGLGSINKMREAVYSAISGFRHEKNAQALADPNKAWDQE